jgi:hypothetical protein
MSVMAKLLKQVSSTKKEKASSPHSIEGVGRDAFVQNLGEFLVQSVCNRCAKWKP